MTIKDEIEAYLDSNDRATVNDIASGIDYSNGYVRKKAKEMHEDGRIDGAKTDRIPAVIINGDYHVLTGNHDYLVGLVKQYGNPGQVKRAKKMDVGELQKFIRDTFADAIVGGPSRWKFWT